MSIVFDNGAATRIGSQESPFAFVIVLLKSFHGEIPTFRSFLKELMLEMAKMQILGTFIKKIFGLVLYELLQTC